jgi:hypothetical protein
VTQVKGNSIEQGGDWIMRDWDAASSQVKPLLHFNDPIESPIEC